tara:strand:+ start:169 stop:396 length:228 start_codon:yes stop_codon:yes gene_type:complete
MTYFFTAIILTTAAVLFFVTGMVYFNYVAAWSDASKADILIIFLSGFFSALCFGFLYTIYEIKSKHYIRRTRIRR